MHPTFDGWYYEETACYDWNVADGGKQSDATCGFGGGSTSSGGASGHFTQVVWKKTRLVGCAKAKSASGAWFSTCHYYPTGNYPNQYTDNIGTCKAGLDTHPAGSNRGLCKTDNDAGCNFECFQRNLDNTLSSKACALTMHPQDATPGKTSRIIRFVFLICIVRMLQSGKGSRRFLVCSFIQQRRGRGDYGVEIGFYFFF